MLSSIITAFLITSLSDLKPNYQQQSALLLYQLLNGRDPNLASMSDPTAPFQPSGSTIAVNCLWSVSLSASLGASFIAMICKDWLAVYNSGTNLALDLLQACWRQHRFSTLYKLKIHLIIPLLHPLLHFSVICFLGGAVVYFWKINMWVATIYLVIGGIVCITYFISTLLPIVMNAPFRPYSAQLVHRLSVAIGKVITRGYFLTLRSVFLTVLRLFAQTTFSKGIFDTFHRQTRKTSPWIPKHMRDWWAYASSGEFDTSQRAQEEAILWLSQMPLDPSESEDVLSSLALISRPHKFPKSLVAFVYFALDSWLREDPNRRDPDSAINCIVLLGHIKYQSVVDRNSDEDHNVGGIPVSPLVAWAAQQLANSGAPYLNETQARLLTAAAWLSPEYATGGTSEGEELEIQDRWEFLKEIEAKLTQHLRYYRPSDKRALINLIHGMHACIPRGNYGSPSSIISFLPSLCEDYDSPWSEDESVLRALITYALDLLLPPERRKPLVEREIEFEVLASELIDELMASDVTCTDAVMFGFWLVYRVPYAFMARKSILTDIVRIWDSTATPEDHFIIPKSLRQRINSFAVDALVAAAQCHIAAKDTRPKFVACNAQNLLRAALEDGYSQPIAVYAVAMIVNLSPLTQAATFAREANVGSYTSTLHVVRTDLEANATEEDTLDLHIYSTLVPSKLQEPQVNVERVRTLIGEMASIIKDPIVVDSGIPRGPKNKLRVDRNRVRWKAIYLSGLLLKSLHPGERELPIETLREMVWTLLESGELLLADDYKRCIEPLDMDVDVSELTTPAVCQDLKHSVFKMWVDGFPLFPLAGSISNPAQW